MAGASRRAVKCGMRSKWINIRDVTGWNRLGDIPEDAHPEQFGWTMTNSWHAFTGVDSGSYSVGEAREILGRSNSVRNSRRILAAANSAGVVKIWSERPLGVAYHPEVLRGWFLNEYRPSANKRKGRRRTVGGTVVETDD